MKRLLSGSAPRIGRYEVARGGTKKKDFQFKNHKMTRRSSLYGFNGSY